MWYWYDATDFPFEAGDDYSICNPPHPNFHEVACKARFPEAYAITYWSHTWCASLLLHFSKIWATMSSFFILSTVKACADQDAMCSQG